MKITDLVQHIIDMWKADEDDHPAASPEQPSLPPNPVGAVSLSDEDLVQVTGGTGTRTGNTAFPNELA